MTTIKTLTAPAGTRGLACAPWSARRTTKEIETMPLDDDVTYLTPGTAYDHESLRFARWITRDGKLVDHIDGLSCWEYFERDGAYLGPDNGGIEPLWMVPVLTIADRDALIAEIDAADLESPEQVADMVLSAARESGLIAGRAKLLSCLGGEGVAINGHAVYRDKSGGEGHCWVRATREDCPADIQEEIAAEIIDGDLATCDDYCATNGEHYRWS